jgi:hypothetical protein
MILFVLLTTLYGISLVEDGEYATSVGQVGSPNGATLAFGAYVLSVLIVALFAAGRRHAHVIAKKMPQVLNVSERQFFIFTGRFLVLNAIFLMVMLFAFGGIHVWMGTLEKGMFRASLGPFGALPFIMTKFVIPALFAYSTVLLMRIGYNVRAKQMWWFNVLLIIVVGSTWGFKTTGVFMLLPGLLILNWRLSLYKMLLLATAFFGSLVVFFFLFDSALMDGVDVFKFLVERLTVMQGDVSWYIWGEYVDETTLPNYFPTLLAGLGDTVISIFVDKGHFLDWMSFHYDWMLTYIATGSEEAIRNGHSVTGTPFSEGVIAGGWIGVALFGIIAGILIGRTYRILGDAIANGRAKTAALLSTYFCFNVFAWLNGGAITQLFHISVPANILFTLLLIKLMQFQLKRNLTVPPNNIHQAWSISS